MLPGEGREWVRLLEGALERFGRRELTNYCSFFLIPISFTYIFPQ